MAAPWTGEQERAVTIASARVWRGNRTLLRRYGYEAEDLRQSLRLYVWRWLRDLPPYLAAHMARVRIVSYLRSTNRLLHLRESDGVDHSGAAGVRVFTPTGDDAAFTMIAEGWSRAEVDRHLGRGEGYTASRLKRARLFADEIQVWSL